VNCRYYRHIINRELNREITDRERRALAIHLTWCERCAARRDSAALAVASVRTAVGTAPRVEIVSRVMARVHQALPDLIRRDQISPRQFAYSVTIATGIAAVLAAALLWLAPGAVREAPVDRIAYWVPKILAEGGKLVMETIQFLSLALADALRLLNAIGTEYQLLGPVRILLIGILTAIVLATTTILVRRDLSRTRSGIH
jgi:hypothetical protein